MKDNLYQFSIESLFSLLLSVSLLVILCSFSNQYHL
nr:MAG TPA: hypothetical protein [Caudoviricetes sp.]